jgi:DNA adenine methylase
VEIITGWIPPEILTEEEYKKIQSIKDDNDPLTAFAGFGCSFGGKWFGGYARSNNRQSYAKNAHNSCLKKIKLLNSENTVFIHSDYKNMTYPSRFVIYTDPPYANTTGYGATGLFNNNEFWEFCRELNNKGCKVFISEYTAPEDFKVVLEIPTKLSMHVKDGKSSKRTEKLFTL